MVRGLLPDQDKVNALVRSTHVQQGTQSPAIYVGSAGWSIPQACAPYFPDGGSHLERYAQVFNAVEINSSFYRTHLPKTYERWAGSVPEGFRFSVKFPRGITHEARLEDCHAALETFLAGVGRLGHKLGCLLLQLPPSLAWNPRVALTFIADVRRMHQGPIVCEPRHASWFHLGASQALAAHQVSRAAADPALCLRALVPAGHHQLEYLRLHGTPRMYHGSYAEASLGYLASRLQQAAGDTAARWCIFDNTADGYAIPNGLSLMAQLGSAPGFHLFSAEPAGSCNP